MKRVRPRTLREAVLAVVSVLGVLLAAWVFLYDNSDASTDQQTHAVAANQQEQPQGLEGRSSDTRPNFLLVMVDDQAMSAFSKRSQPFAFNLFSKKKGGTMFTNGFAAPPLCCPSRATFQTGQYPHNHGVVVNDYGLLRDRENVISTWMQDAGYSTGFVGKYMNNYEPIMGSAPAPGYDYWWAMHGKPGYWDYKVSVNGEVRKMGSRTKDYSTDVITRRSLAFLDKLRDKSKPFFLWTSYYAPHGRKQDETSPACRNGYNPPPLKSDWRRWRHFKLKKDRSYNERNFRDKPAEMRKMYPPLGPGSQQEIKTRQACALATMMPVDRGMKRIWHYLRDKGLDRDTVIFYVSDNGFFYGSHRISHGKVLPYMDAMRVPIAARIPKAVLGSEPKAEVSAPVGILDVIPTVVDLAGAETCHDGRCRVMDGRSLVDVIDHGPNPSWASSRDLLFELGAPPSCGKTYASVLSGSEQLTQWYGPGPGRTCKPTDREYYDLSNDPYQMRNLLGDLGPNRKARKHKRRRQLLRVEQRALRINKRTRKHVRRSGLDETLDRLQHCSGVQGRDTKSGDRPFCS